MILFPSFLFLAFISGQFVILPPVNISIVQNLSARTFNLVVTTFRLTIQLLFAFIFTYTNTTKWFDVRFRWSWKFPFEMPLLFICEIFVWIAFFSSQQSVVIVVTAPDFHLNITQCKQTIRSIHYEMDIVFNIDNKIV